MIRSPTVILTLACAGALFGCSDSGSQRTSNPCTRDELVGCGVACTEGSNACGAGLYCDQTLCAAQCTPATTAIDCGGDSACSTEGKCVPLPGSSGGGATAGSAGNGSAGNGGGDGGSACGEVKLEATPKTPNVIVIVDQSGSMNQSFGATGSRWDVLKASLLADDGLFAALQSQVRFGLVLYSSIEGGPTCPLLTRVDVAINNLAAIRAAYEPQAALEDTPTGDTIDSVVTQLQGTPLLTGDDPTIFVLATDGEPDTCAEPDPQRGQPQAVAAVQRAFSLGVRTYLIAVAEEAELSADHLRDMANAGVGVTPGMPDAPSFRVNNDAGLRTALSGIVGGELSCIVPLKGKVTASDPCVGTVRLDGKVLACGAADGWKLINESSIEITGAACDTLKTGKLLEATFPCNTAIVL